MLSLDNCSLSDVISVCSAGREVCAYSLVSTARSSAATYAECRDAGEIWGGVRKKGSELVPFHSEDKQTLEQVGRRACAVSFLDTFQDWNLEQSCLNSLLILL